MFTMFINDTKSISFFQNKPRHFALPINMDTKPNTGTPYYVGTQKILQDKA